MVLLVTDDDDDDNGSTKKLVSRLDRIANEEQNQEAKRDPASEKLCFPVVVFADVSTVLT